MQVKLLELLLTYSHHWSDGQGAERQRVVRGDESSGKIWAIQVSNLTERLLVSKTILLNTISFTQMVTITARIRSWLLL